MFVTVPPCSSPAVNWDIDGIRTNCDIAMSQFVLNATKVRCDSADIPETGDWTAVQGPGGDDIGGAARGQDHVGQNDIGALLG